MIPPIIIGVVGCKQRGKDINYWRGRIYPALLEETEQLRVPFGANDDPYPKNL